MSSFAGGDDPWTERQRQRWLRPDAERYWRPDAARWIKPALSYAIGPLVTRKYNFDPAQPRVPAGDPDGGQWTDANGNALGSGRIRLAGEVPTNGLPDIPKERPPTARLRNRWARLAARRFGAVGVIAELGVEWLYNEYEPLFRSYFDEPKSLDELQRNVLKPEKGYDIHHIVERATASESETELIDAPENLVRIPRWKHWDLNAWYETERKEYGGATTREYLKGKSWEERRAVGLRGLREIGVLK